MPSDGASDSKPSPASDTKHPTFRKPERKPSKLRRYMSLSTRGHAVPSKADANSPRAATPPMQTLSPRPTSFEPGGRKHTKRSIPVFLLSKDPPANPCGHAVSEARDQGRSAQGCLPVTANPYQAVHTQPREDSAMKLSHSVPGSPWRNAALTSHPVGKEDLESEEEFRTPGEFWGCQKVDYLGE